VIFVQSIVDIRRRILEQNWSSGLTPFQMGQKLEQRSPLILARLVTLRVGLDREWSGWLGR
jgi:hypothetical protein